MLYDPRKTTKTTKTMYRFNDNETIFLVLSFPIDVKTSKAKIEVVNDAQIGSFDKIPPLVPNPNEMVATSKLK